MEVGRAGDPGLGPVLSRVIQVGALLFPVLFLALWLWSPLGFWDALLLGSLVELLPVLALAQVPLAGQAPIPRIPAYLVSGLTILLLGGVSFLFGIRSLGLVEMGLGAISPGRAGAWTGGAILCAVVLLAVFHGGRKVLGIQESPLLSQLLPRSSGEKALFVFLSCAAGLGEEVAYRGYVIPILAGVIGSVWGAAILSSMVFGVLHAYQGWLGIFRTGALGFLLAASFLLSGSLWPAILAHTIVDLLGGLVLGEALVRE
ncbi:CPBP family intramembrane glutamic endopeptidase [Gemmatimonadota bacterium]